MDPVAHIRQFNAGRDAQLLAIKYARVRASHFAFFRGSCHLFDDRLGQEPGVQTSPLVWACGDLHPENFGSYKGDNGLLCFDVNDFDEAALAPAAFDLIRMLAGIRVGTQALHHRAAGEHPAAQCFLHAYAAALAGGKPYGVERETATGPVRALLDGLHQRSRSQFLDTRTERKGSERRIRLDDKKPLPYPKCRVIAWPNSCRPLPKASPIRTSSRFWTSPGASPAPGAWAWHALSSWCKARARPRAITCSI